MRMRRPRSALFLFLCGVILLISIFAGEKMGERVLGHATESAVLVPEVQTPVARPTLGPEAGPIRDWRKLQVVSVATDPGFPDPRVTKPPTPTPKPTRTPTPTPTPFVPTPTPTPPGPDIVPSGSTPLPTAPPPGT